VAVDIDPAFAMRERDYRPAMLHEFTQVCRTIVPEAPGPIIGIVGPAFEDNGIWTIFPVSRQFQGETQAGAATA
jgi:hypothetical protein